MKVGPFRFDLYSAASLLDHLERFYRKHLGPDDFAWTWEHQKFSYTHMGPREILLTFGFLALFTLIYDAIPILIGLLLPRIHKRGWITGKPYTIAKAFNWLLAAIGFLAALNFTNTLVLELMN